MKKVLLTTTALSLLAGAAAADVSFSGLARFGVISTGGTVTTQNRMRLNVVGSTEADNGLSFGAMFRMQATNTSAAATAAMGASGPNVWVSNGTMTLTMGNTGGAIASAANIWGCGVGFGGHACNDMADNSFTNHTTFASSGAGPNIVRLNFALGSANIAVSGGHTAAGAVANNEIAANFAVGGATIGIGYEAAAVSPTTFLNLGFDAGSATLGLRYASGGGSNGYIAHMTYGIGSGSLYVYAGNNLAGVAQAGLSYSMALGGGVTAAVAVYSAGGVMNASAGANFNF